VVASPWAILHLQDGKCGTRLVPRVEDAVEEYDVGIVKRSKLRLSPIRLTIGAHLGVHSFYEPVGKSVATLRL
jgi:hypothetical protein